MSEKNYTRQLCENAIYLSERNGIKHFSSVENAIGLSRGYISRCLNHENKKVSVDVAIAIAEFFDVSLNDLCYVDLRGYENMLNSFGESFEEQEETNE